MLTDRVSNLGPLTYESGALPIALRGPAGLYVNIQLVVILQSLAYQQSLVNFQVSLKAVVINILKRRTVFCRVI